MEKEQRKQGGTGHFDREVEKKIGKYVKDLFAKLPNQTYTRKTR